MSVHFQNQSRLFTAGVSPALRDLRPRDYNAKESVVVSDVVTGAHTVVLDFHRLPGCHGNIALYRRSYIVDIICFVHMRR